MGGQSNETKKKGVRWVSCRVDHQIVVRGQSSGGQRAYEECQDSLLP